MKRLMIIDGNALVHRAYYALPKLTKKNGELVNAVYGFLLLFLKAIKEFRPDYICACFDLPAPTFRHKEFAEYKATRVKAPDELYEQIPKIKKILSVFRVPIFEKKGFEADDLIATIAKKAEELDSKIGDEAIESIILSGDLDILQMVDEKTKVCLPKKGVSQTILYDEKRVWQRYQISPSCLPDFKALRGDPSDNIPGVPGIGEKTAIELLKEFGSLENLYQAIEEKSERAERIKPKIKETLQKLKEQVFFSRMLAQTRNDVPLDFDLKKCQWRNYDKTKAAEIFKQFEFHSLIKRLPGFEGSKGKTTKKLALWGS